MIFFGDMVTLDGVDIKWSLISLFLNNNDVKSCYEKFCVSLKILIDIVQITSMDEKSYPKFYPWMTYSSMDDFDDSICYLWITFMGEMMDKFYIQYLEIEIETLDDAHL